VSEVEPMPTLAAPSQVKGNARSLPAVAGLAAKAGLPAVASESKGFSLSQISALE
jgi:hypothetical protein